MTNRNDPQARDLLERATKALWSVPVPEEALPRLMATTVEAAKSVCQQGTTNHTRRPEMSFVQDYLESCRSKQEPPDYAQLAFSQGADLVQESKKYVGNPGLVKRCWDEALVAFQEALRAVRVRSVDRGMVPSVDQSIIKAVEDVVLGYVGANNILKDFEEFFRRINSLREAGGQFSRRMDSILDIFDRMRDEQRRQSAQNEELWKQARARQSDATLRFLRALGGSCLDCGCDGSTRWQPRPPCRCRCHNY